MTAIDRVREAVASKRVEGLDAEFSYTWECVAGHERHAFTVEIDRRAEVEEDGPTLCGAAVACLRALGALGVSDAD